MGRKSGTPAVTSSSAGFVLTTIFGKGPLALADALFVLAGESAATAAGGLCANDHGPLIESAVNHRSSPARKNFSVALSRINNAGVLTTRSTDLPAIGFKMGSPSMMTSTVRFVAQMISGG